LRLTTGTLLETQRKLNFKNMPSGYTSDIYNGKEVTFKDFALGCARAFGACVMQRDDPADEKPKIMPEESYHTEELKKLNKFKKPTKAQFDSYVKETIADCEKSIKEKNELKKRYSDILENAKNWQPPTKEHERLKAFMIEQLTDSRSFDCCGLDHYEHELKVVSAMTYEDYVTKKLTEHNRSIKYHEEYEAKDLFNIKQRNKWIKDLYDSL
jgi:hypothetical protein